MRGLLDFLVAVIVILLLAVAFLVGGKVAELRWRRKGRGMGDKVTTDRETMDRTIGPDGQQAQYLVLSEEERARGFVRPVRRTYRHLKCGATTTMGLAIAETYARNPSFYTGTFCSECRTHPPVGEAGEFVWVGGFVLTTNAQRFVQNPGEEKVGT